LRVGGRQVRRVSCPVFTRAMSAIAGYAGARTFGNNSRRERAHHRLELARNGYLILKFFLNVSRDEQKKRFLERLDEPEKNWKFSPADVKERNCWDDYMKAYEDAIRRTSAPHAPWYVVPADNKWFTRLVVSAAIVQAIEQLGLRFPTIDAAVAKEFAECRKWLLAEKS